jgi:probable HAF family extracellular repeat protein
MTLSAIRITFAILAAAALAGCSEVAPLTAPPDALFAGGMASGYTAISLGTLGGRGSFATDINNNGVVVGVSGTATGSSRAFRWTAREGMQDLGTLGGDFSIATAVNNRGDISVISDDAAGVQHAARWTAESGLQRLPTICEDEGHFGTAVDINDHGDIVGMDAGLCAVVWHAGGSGAILHVNGWVHAINNDGIAVGVGGGVIDVCEHGGDCTEFSGLMYGRGSEGRLQLADRERMVLAMNAVAINDGEEILGEGSSFKEVWREGRLFFYLLVPDGPSGPILWRDGFVRVLPFSGVAINNRGDIVGSGMVLVRGGRRDQVSWLGGTVTGINDPGEVVGSLDGVATLWKRHPREVWPLTGSAATEVTAGTPAARKPPLSGLPGAVACPKSLRRLAEVRGWPECPAP